MASSLVPLMLKSVKNNKKINNPVICYSNDLIVYTYTTEFKRKVLGPLYTTPEKLENGVSTRPEKFENATVTGHFGFVLEENLCRKIK